MIRRLLIVRLRRHTRLARALAARAPLASRAAVDQPLLRAVGLAPMTPRRARAPVFFVAPPEPDTGGIAPSPVADRIVPHSEPLPGLAAGGTAPFPAPSPESAASGGALSSRPAARGSGEPAASGDALSSRPAAGEGAPFPVLSPAPVAGSATSFPTLPEPVAAPPEPARTSPEAAAGSAAPSPNLLPEPRAGGAAPFPTLLHAPQAGSAVPVEVPPESVESPPETGSGSAAPSPTSLHAPQAGSAASFPTLPERVEGSAAPSASPGASAFDRSPAAWMERLRADEQRRRQQEASASPAPAGEPASVPSMAPDSGGASALSPASAAALSGEESLPGIADSPEIAPFDAPDRVEGASSATSAPTGTHVPDQAAPSVVSAPTNAPSSASTALSAAPAPTTAPSSASAAPSVTPPAAQGASQPVDPAAALVAMARAWVAQRLQERSSSAAQPQSTPPPAAPNPQAQPQAPVEIRVARPPRFIEERTPLPSTGSGSAVSDGTRLPESAPAAETLRESEQSSTETPAFDRSVEAWMDRLRADERRRRQKEAEAHAPGRLSEDARQQLPAASPAIPAQPASASPPLGATQAAFGGERQRSAPQPAIAPQLSSAAPSVRPMRFAPPVGAAVRPAAPGGARFPAPSAPSALPLSGSNQRFLRAAIGVDPATVRISRGPEASRVTAAHRADAVTLGDDVALAPGRGDETAESLGLLAHELTHVARQRDPTFIPPIAHPPEQRPGLRPAPPGPATDEEALARTVEAQTVQAARMRFVPPAAPAHADASATPPDQAPERIHAAPPGEGAPAAPDRARWGNLPAPWEPLLDWLAPPKPTIEAPPLPVVTVAPAPPTLTAPPQPGSPVARTAETMRRLPAVQQTETTAPAQEPSPAPDLDELARQVYAVLKRRLAAERRRSGW